jgi:hypothetical protein
MVPLQQQAGSAENKNLVKVQKIVKEPNDRIATQPFLLIGNVNGSIISFFPFQFLFANLLHQPKNRKQFLPALIVVLPSISNIVETT